MAVYKVPQDVEADDKLIGPFSFRQFIYLIIVAISMAGSWGLSQLFIPLAIIPLPIIVFFGALALPLRKDQPMEAYLSAVVSYYFLKSRKRFWQPDGINSFITIIPPKDSDRILTKDLNQEEATKRLGYLADLVDTHGWAIRGAGNNAPDTSISTDLYYESQQTVDMMDQSTPSAQAMSKHLQEVASDHKKEIADSMKSTTKVATPVPTKDTKTASGSKSTPAVDTPPVSALPTVDEIIAKQEAHMKQQKQSDSLDAITLARGLAERAGEERGTVIATPTLEKAPNTSVSTPGTDTMVLTQKQAKELSLQEHVTLQTLSGQANRIAQKNKVLRNGDEVTISFH